MPDSEIGFTDRGGEQLFEADPGNRCFAAAAQGNNWLKMESCIPFHTTTSPFRKIALRGALFTTRSFMSTKTCRAANSTTEQQEAHYCSVTSGNFLNYKRGMTR